MFASIQNGVSDSANFVLLSYFDHTTEQMTTQELLLCEYLAAADQIHFSFFFFPLHQTNIPFSMSYLFSGRAILMQITKTRMWGKGIQTRRWWRYDTPAVKPESNVQS